VAPSIRKKLALISSASGGTQATEFFTLFWMQLQAEFFEEKLHLGRGDKEVQCH
jgi:hypothetical protein